ncbi:hypothetical protein [Polaromonas hydrogenivorans]|uniref:Uncharacterized protein n=1 Tax=Polaromonas hydrogenivorans TaxID=335476 RepID=A0AAU7LU64_9BURK
MQFFTLLRCLACALVAGGLTFSGFAGAWELAGTQTIRLHGRDGQIIPVGTVRFEPRGEQVVFTLKMDPTRLKDFFLSMREFKCVEGMGEVMCHVPYPYAHPATVSMTDFAWLEHSLLFFYKQPRDFGAKLWNGVYYQLSRTERGLEGKPQAVDLNQIGVPPENLAVPPFTPAERGDVPAGLRWFDRLTIE